LPPLRTTPPRRLRVGLQAAQARRVRRAHCRHEHVPSGAQRRRAAITTELRSAASNKPRERIQPAVLGKNSPRPVQRPRGAAQEGQVPARVASLVLAVHQVRRDSVDTEAELLERPLDAAAPVGHWLRRPLVPWATDISKHAPGDVSLPSCCSWATASRTAALASTNPLSENATSWPSCCQFAAATSAFRPARGGFARGFWRAPAPRSRHRGHGPNSVRPSAP
jgi:hypothetical protein